MNNNPRPLVAPARPLVNGPAAPRDAARAEARSGTADEQRAVEEERAVDAVLADSFPASDPPSWTLGRARRGIQVGP